MCPLAYVKFNSEVGKTAFIGPRGRLPAEETGRGLSERSEFRSPDGGSSDRASKPDNSGGASWFVLLAAEKNEQIEI